MRVVSAAVGVGRVSRRFVIAAPFKQRNDGKMSSRSFSVTSLMKQPRRGSWRSKPLCRQHLERFEQRRALDLQRSPKD